MKHPRKYKGTKDSEKEPHPSHVTEEQVISYLSSMSQPESIRQIAHGMELQHHGRRFLPRIIQYLKSRGDVEEIRGGKYRLAESGQSSRSATKGKKSAATENQKHADAGSESAGGAGAARRSPDPNLIAGRIVAHRDGYGFLVPDKPIPRVEGDLFIGRDAMADAMHGDRVLARVERRKADGRAEGRVVQVLERENPTVVGLFRYGPHGNVVLPYDTRIQHEVAIPPGDELTPDLREKVDAAKVGSAVTNYRRSRLPELDGAVVNVEITRYPKGGLAPAGRVIEILGRPGDIGVDVEIIIRKHHLPHIFPAEVVAEAKSEPQRVSEADLRGRRDFRDLPIVTIDGETARDFDDAVHVTELPSGSYELQVHIADVAHYVERNSPLDREAHLRGTFRLFSESRRTHAAGGTFEWDLFAKSKSRPAGDERDHGNRRERKHGARGIHSGRDSFCGAHDVYQRAQDSRGRCGNERALCAARREFQADERAGAAAQQETGCARVD